MLYKLTISPYSSFDYPVQSDTLFGAFCWSYKYLYGAEELENFLEICVNDKPPIIFSNMFFENMLPLPLNVLDYIKYNDNSRSFEDYKKLKKLNENSFLPEKIFFETLVGNYDNVMGSFQNVKIVKETQIHTMVDRCVVDEDKIGGNLYTTKNNYYNGNFNIYILCDDINKYIKVLKLMFELGIGSRKSTGKGAFKLVKCVEANYMFENKENANAFVSLSNFVPNKIDSTVGAYNLIMKFSKLDREFVSSGKPFKKPLIMIQAGSCFLYNVKVKEKMEYCGKCIKNVSNFYSKITTNACGIAIPMILNENSN